MDNVITRIEIDLYSPTSYEVIKAQQGDNNSRIIEFVITNQGECYTISDTCFAKFEGHRGDGSSFIKNAIIKDNIVTVVLDEDILFYSGTVEAKIVFYEHDNSILSPIPIKIFVQKNPCDKENIIETDKSLINQLIIAQEIHNSNKNIHITLEDKEELYKELDNKLDKTIDVITNELSNWSIINNSNLNSNLKSIAYGKDKFVAVGTG